MSSTVQEVLQIERKKTAFCTQRMRDFLYGADFVAILAKARSKNLEYPYDFNIYNEGRVALIKDAYRTVPIARAENMVQNLTPERVLRVTLASIHQFPGAVHYGMFMRCIEFLGTDSQQNEYLDKCRSMEIVGCYAQTEIGHGSDVQSLQTTATYMEETDEFIVNTPSISAAKFWPGQLGINANYALVFAQMIIKGENHGVHSFLVRIRDDEYNPMPGIQVGDIGPKIGFHAKDNGYLLMHNIRIPKRNMLRKYISVSKKGQIKKKGDPKVSYATMMSIRMLISTILPKQYSQVITIATRYSMFRRQFRDKTGEEIPVIEYQLQQQKIINRVAQFYGITIAGNSIRKLTMENFRRVREKEDFSLMAETHACLCFSKSFFSETAFYGMEICRRACGGQGFSQYSGMPSIYYEFSSNLTHEGENTILYLQTARFLLKSYKYSITKKKPLDDSVKYIDSYDFLMGKKCEVNGDDPLTWTLEDLRILLAQSVCQLISATTGKIMSKDEKKSSADHLNQNVGIRLQQVSKAHACYYTYNSFREAVIVEKDEVIRSVTANLCMLYGINLIMSQACHIIEGGFIEPAQIASLRRAAQLYLKKLRPQLIGLVDSFDLTPQEIRSELTYGDPYENFYRKAKQCSLNKEVQEAAIIVKDNIQQTLKPKL